VLGREPPLQVTVDATVLAGLELEAPHAIVRNSFRNDLANLKTELLAHDTIHA
jgi:F-type H+-transporting ATPase subunit b